MCKMSSYNYPKPEARSLICALKENLKHYSVIYETLRLIKRKINRVKTILFWFPYLLYYTLRNIFKHDVILSQCYSKFRGYTLCPNNWGDDINKYFFEYAANVKVAVLPFIRLYFTFGLKKYSLIGSRSREWNLDKCIVYGTGLMRKDAALTIKGTPEKIISVRGSKTREALIQAGMNCPEHYGDIALLLPLFYTPKPAVKNYVSVIQHLVTVRNSSPIVEELTQKHGCRMINMTKYNNWTDIIDMITGSSFVITESLHGLVTAETYNIPCVWVEFTNHDNLEKYKGIWSFKFLDFYESIGKYNMQSIKLYEGYDFDELMSFKDKWKPGNIDYEKMLGYFPFEIKPEFKAHIAEFLSNHK